MRRRWRWRTIATVVLAVVLMAPAVLDIDSVPLSSYAMYATPRAETAQFVVPVGLDADGAEIELSASKLLGTRDPLIAASYLRDQARMSRALDLCIELLDGLEELGPDAGVVQLELMLEEHRVVDRARGEPSLVSRESLGRCFQL